MNQQHLGFRPLNCNPHHEIVVKLKHSLAECSSGDRQLLFETRETLRDLSQRIEEGSWSLLARLTHTVELMLGHLLRRGGLDVPETMQTATDLLDFVNNCLTLPPPISDTGAVGRELSSATTIAVDTNGPKAVPKLKLGDAARSSTPAATAPTASKQSHEIDHAAEQRASTVKRTDLDFNTVSYQMVNESRLGELLIKMGCIQPSQLDRALVLQKLSRKKLGEVLMAMEAVDLRALQAALEVQRQETLRFTDERAAARMAGEAVDFEGDTTARAS